MTIAEPLFWDGAVLDCSTLTIAVLTQGAQAVGEVRALSCVVVTDRRGVWLVKPAEVGQFLKYHAGVHLVCHGAGELHLTLHNHLNELGDKSAKDILWAHVREGRVQDVAVLDQLLRLAADGNCRPQPLPLD